MVEFAVLLLEFAGSSPSASGSSGRAVSSPLNALTAASSDCWETGPSPSSALSSFTSEIALMTSARDGGGAHGGGGDVGKPIGNVGDGGGPGGSGLKG